MALSFNSSCAANPLFLSTADAYIAANTDAELSTWWQNKTTGEHTSFVNELASSYGDQQTGYKCGVGWINTCTLPSCSRKFVQIPSFRERDANGA
jgi:hypothetical protein